jgi:hypothetical protein
MMWLRDLQFNEKLASVIELHPYARFAACVLRSSAPTRFARLAADKGPTRQRLRKRKLSPTLTRHLMRSARFQFWFGYWPAVSAASGPRLLY